MFIQSEKSVEHKVVKRVIKEPIVKDDVVRNKPHEKSVEHKVVKRVIKEPIVKDDVVRNKPHEKSVEHKVVKKKKNNKEKEDGKGKYAKDSNKKEKVALGRVDNKNKDFTQEEWDRVEIGLRDEISTTSFPTINDEEIGEVLSDPEYRPNENRTIDETYTTSEFRDFEADMITDSDRGSKNYEDKGFDLSDY